MKANLLTAALPPVYRVLAMAGALPILLLGARNVMGTGWRAWDVAAFTTFLSCFTRLATKSSSAAKLFNAVHRAQVSWRRIRPLMQDVKSLEPVQAARARRFTCGSWPLPIRAGKRSSPDCPSTRSRAEILGVTGPVACGKSTLGRAFLCEYPYQGSIRSAKRSSPA